MHKVLVYDNTSKIKLGFGWIYYHASGEMSIPELWYDNGEEIPSGDYILVHTDEDHLVVVPKTIKH